MYKPSMLLGKFLVRRCRPQPDKPNYGAHRFFDRTFNCEPLKRHMVNTLFVSLIVWLSLVSIALGQSPLVQALHPSAAATSGQTSPPADRNKMALDANAGPYERGILGDMV